MLGTILLIVLILMLIGTFPVWPYAQAWGRGPSSGLAIAIVIILVLVLSGHI